MNETKHKTRERQLHRQEFSEYALTVSRHYAAAWALVGLGLALFILSMAMAPDSLPVAGAWMTIGITLIFAGTGWALMLRKRLDDYREDILDTVAVDEETTTTHDTPPMMGTRPIPVTDNKGHTEMMELDDNNNPLSHGEWIAVSPAVLVGNSVISEKSLCRDSNLITQGQYKAMFSYLRLNHYIHQERGKNKLTERGMRYFERFAPTHPTD